MPPMRSRGASFAAHVAEVLTSPGNLRGATWRLLHSFGLLGAGVVLSGVSVLFAIYLWRIEWTQTDDSGVPVLHQRATLYAVWIPGTFAYLFATCSNATRKLAGTSLRASSSFMVSCNFLTISRTHSFPYS